MLVPSKYIKTQAERLNVLPAFIYVEREPDFVLAASVSGANLATELCCLVQGMSYAATAEGPVKIYAQIYLQAPAE